MQPLHFEIWRWLDGDAEFTQLLPMTGISMQDDVFTILRNPANPLQIESELQKGPFRIDGVFIDSHWNSHAKWQVLQPILEQHLHILHHRKLKLADVGANNGYYLFRLIHWLESINAGWISSDRHCLAIDPVQDFEDQFRFLHSLLSHYPVEFRRAGWQSLGPPASSAFDMILCMGVLYHHTDPFEMLRRLHAALRKGGCLILETMVVESRGDKVPYALLPKGRYAGASGIWLVPDLIALEAMMHRTGWHKVQICHVRDAFDEQKRMNEFPSYREMLNLENIENPLTIEGLPAHRRDFLTAYK